MGWGNLSWGSGNWGREGDVAVQVTGVSSSTSLNFGEGWGRGAWGAEAWNQPVGNVSGNAIVLPTGLNSNFSTDDVDISGNATITPTSVSAITSLGTASAAIGIEVSPTAVTATSATGTVSIGEGIGVQPSGVSATSSLGTESITGSATIDPTTNLITITADNPTIVADASFSVTGVSATTNLGTETIQAGATATPSGESLSSSLGTVIAESENVLEVTGFGLNTNLGTPIAQANADVSPTSLSLTSSLAPYNNVPETGNVTFSALADAQISTAQSKFGGSSLELDGTGDRIQSTDITLGTGNWTWETFAYFDSLASTQCIWDGGENVGLNGNPVLYITSTNLQLSFAGGTYINQAHGMSTGQWHHIAITRNSGTLTAYIDGTSIGTASIGAVNCPASNHVLGGNYAGTFTMDGYLDESRITTRVVYTSNFTPPSAPFTGIAGTDLWLLHYDGANGSTDIVNSVPDSKNFSVITGTGINVSVTSVTSSFALGTATAFADVVVDPVGQSSLITIGVPGVTPWEALLPGATNNYNNVNPGATNSFTNVNPGATNNWTEVNSSVTTSYTSVNPGVTNDWTEAA